MMIVSLTLLFAALGAQAAPPVGALAPSTSPAPDRSDGDVLNEFIAALLTRDEERALLLAEPQILVDPAIDARPGLRDTTVAEMLEQVRSCDIGAVTKSYSREAGYGLNWWCDYSEREGARIPTSGSHVSIGVAGGRVRLRNFSYGIPYGLPARRAER